MVVCEGYWFSGIYGLVLCNKNRDESAGGISLTGY